MIVMVETELLPLPKDVLNWKASAGKWSILECVEHLNRYNRHYNIELEKALSKPVAADTYKPGWLGNYFVKSVSPENRSKMKTMAHLNPQGSKLNEEVLQEFLGHQRHLLQLCATARKANLNRRAVRVEIFRLLRMKTGDAFRFLLAHQQRHLLQALEIRRNG